MIAKQSGGWGCADPSRSWRNRSAAADRLHRGDDGHHQQAGTEQVPSHHHDRQPEGVLQVGGYWIFDEFAGAGGIASVGLEDKVPQPATTEERSSILDLFKR